VKTAMSTIRTEDHRESQAVEHMEVRFQAGESYEVAVRGRRCARHGSQHAGVSSGDQH
jgi:hypothetical protein